MKSLKTTIFGGTSGEKLARTLGKKLHIPLGKTELQRFANGEFRLRLLSSASGRECLVVQSTGNPVHDNLFELFLLVDTLKKSGAKEITTLIPYFGYSRQHTQFRVGEGVSSEIILRTLKLLGANRIITLDFHNLPSLMSSPVPITNISALSFLAHHIRKHVNIRKTVVVSPDEGGIERARLFAASLFGKNKGIFTFVRKERSFHKAHHIKRASLNQPNLVKKKAVIIVDDICTSGKTLLSAVNLCLNKGATEVFAAVTHPDVNKETLAAVAKSPLKKFFTTNSMGRKTSLENSRKIVAVDIAKVILPSLRL